MAESEAPAASGSQSVPGTQLIVEENAHHEENGNCIARDSSQPSQSAAVTESEDNKNGSETEDKSGKTKEERNVPDGNDLVKCNGDKHSIRDSDKPHARSSDGSTTPNTMSESSSPCSELSDEFKCEQIVETRLRYTRDQLLRLMDVPASRIWPEYFDVAFMKPQRKMFDLEKWMKAKQDSQYQSASASSRRPPLLPLPNGSGVGISQLERPPETELKWSKDPRERVKHDEQDGIVLSPQRRSFGTGCHVSQQGPIIMGMGPDSRESHREMPVRRIGSGRIMRREDPDQINLSDRRRVRDNDRDLDPRRDHKEWRSKIDNRYDRDRDERHIDRRRHFFEDDRNDDKRGDRRDLRDNRRYSDHREPHRRSSTSKDFEEEAPEWFTSGPSSQNEFIELVGFDEEEKPAGKPKRERRRSKKEKGGSAKNSRSNTPIIIEKDEPQETKFEKEPPKIEKPVVIEPPPDQDAIQFNVEDYLGSILNLGSDDMFQSGSGASRLKQFFKNRESPVEERAKNTEDKKNIGGKFPQLGNLLGFAEPVIRIPSPNTGLDSSRFFTPISPADKSLKSSVDAVVEMRQQFPEWKRLSQPTYMPGSGRLPPPSVKDLLKGGKGQSLEEIEASLRKGPQQHPMSACLASSYSKPQQQPQMRLQTMSNHHNAFSDFFSQVSEIPRRLVVEKGRESENILAQLLKDAPVNSASLSNKPAMPNNAPTESELISCLMKGNNATNVNGGWVPPLSVNGPPPVPPFRPNPSLGAGVNLLGHSLPSNPPSTIPQHSPSRSHLLPPQQQQHLPPSSNSDIFMMLMQSQLLQQQQQQQQQQLQQQKKHVMHPAFQQEPQTQHHDPIKQLLGGFSNLGLTSAQQTQEQLSRDSLKRLRPEVHSLLQRVLMGQVTETQLMVQLSSGNLSPSHREAVATVLKLLNCPPPSNTLMPPRTTLTPSPTSQTMLGGGLTLGTTPSSLSPRVASPNPDGSNMLAPHMVQQTRVSPLMFGGPRRTPSHQELVVHTQSILQKALLKQELEKAKAKHRKRDSERARSPNPAAPSMHNGPMGMTQQNTQGANRGNQSGSPKAKCQSPLVFTPTSVIRKMTAEKDRLDKDSKPDLFSVATEAEKNSREQQANRMSNIISSQVSHQQGINLKVDKQLRKVPSPLPSGNSVLGPRAQMVMSGGQTNPLMNMGPNPHGLVHSQRQMPMQTNIAMGRPNQHNINNIRVLQHQIQQASLNQQASLTQQIMRSQMSHVGNMGHHHSMQNRIPSAQSTAMQHMVIGNNNNNYKQETNLAIPCTMGTSTSQSNSPVHNLMNFFGRDVMAKVQAGAMPELPGGKVLSLEEVERLQQTQAVPN